MRAQRIRTKPDMGTIILGGWLQDRDAYLWFGIKGPDGQERCIGTLGGQRLYRLAKAIVARYESSGRDQS